jgi:hypothetical protein
LKDLQYLAEMRGKTPSEIMPFWMRKGSGGDE